MLLDELAARLVAQGVGVIGESIFVSSRAVIPAGDGPYLSIIETGGLAPKLTQNQAGPSTQLPGILVNVRAKAYDVAHARARLAYNALFLFNTTLSGVFYLSLTPSQEPFDLGVDAVGRAQSVFNVLAVKRPS